MEGSGRTAVKHCSAVWETLVVAVQQLLQYIYTMQDCCRGGCNLPHLLDLVRCKLEGLQLQRLALVVVCYEKEPVYFGVGRVVADVGLQRHGTII